MANQNNPNVSLGKDPSNLLYQFASSGGGFTKLQRSAADLGGLAGEAIATSQILQQATQTIGGAVNTGMNIYTDEKSRQFKIKMLDTLHATEQSLLGVDDPTQHEEIYKKALDGLQTELSESGVIKKDDLDYFNTFISSQQNKYNEQNFVLTQKKAGNDMQIEHNKTSTHLDSVVGNFDEHQSLIESSAKDKIEGLMQGGYSQDKAESVAKQGMMQQILVGANSKANPDIVEQYATKIYEKDKDGNFKYFQRIQGEDRQELGQKLKDIAGKNRYGKYVLQLAQDQPLNERVILKDPFLDNQSKATLINRNRALLEERKGNAVKGYIKDVMQSNLGYTSRPEEVETFLNGESFKKQTADKGINPMLLSQMLRTEYQKQRDKFEKDPMGMLLSDPRYQGLPRDNLLNMQKVFGLGTNQVEILSESEKKQFSDIFNNAQTPEDKMKIANFDHELTQGFLASMNIKDTLQQKQFTEKYRWDILKNVKTIAAEDKVALDIMTQNQGNTDSTMFAKKMFNVSIDRHKRGSYAVDDEAIESKASSEFKKEWADSDYGKYLLRNGYDAEYKTYLKAGQIYSNSKYGKGDNIADDLQEALNVGVIKSSNMDIHYNKNFFKKGDLKSQLNDLQRGYDTNKNFLLNSLPNGSQLSELTKDPKTIRKIKDHGKWVADGDNGFALVVEDAEGNNSMFGYVPIKKDKNSQYIDIPFNKTNPIKELMNNEE